MEIELDEDPPPGAPQVQFGLHWQTGDDLTQWNAAANGMAFDFQSDQDRLPVTVRARYGFDNRPVSDWSGPKIVG